MQRQYARGEPGGKSKHKYGTPDRASLAGGSSWKKKKEENRLNQNQRDVHTRKKRALKAGVLSKESQRAPKKGGWKKGRFPNFQKWGVNVGSDRFEKRET